MGKSSSSIQLSNEEARHDRCREIAQLDQEIAQLKQKIAEREQRHIAQDQRLIAIEKNGAVVGDQVKQNAKDIRRVEDQTADRFEQFMNLMNEGFARVENNIIRVENSLKEDIIRVETNLKNDIIRVETNLKNDINRKKNLACFTQAKLHLT